MNIFPFPCAADDAIVGAVIIIANQRHERFATLVATGQSGAAAYRSCYRARGASAEANASRLLRNDKVRTRIAELQTATATAAVMSLEEKRLFLAAIVRTPIGRVDEHSPLCQFFRRTKGGLHITMPDKLRAIELDARLAGELMGNTATANVAVKAQVNQYVVTEERRLELIERRRIALLAKS